MLIRVPVLMIILPGLPLLDPIEDMKVKGDDFAKTVQKIEILEKKLLTHSMSNDPDLESFYALCNKKFEV